MIFDDRADAGRRLAQRLAHLRAEDPVVVGLPRGGVPVAVEVAQALEAPLDVIVVRKLGVPNQPEYAMGAVGDGGVLVVNEAVVRQVGVQREEFLMVVARERAEVQRRAHRFRGDRPAISLAGRTVVVVDDGIATGATARAACRVVRASGAARVVLAVPVAPMDWLATIGPDADEMIALHRPRHLHAVGQYYVDFAQTSDEEVIACLERASSRNLPQGLRALPTQVDRPGLCR